MVDRVIGPANILLPPTPPNVAPVWNSTPAPSFVEGTPANFPASGTYQSNGYVTDADGDSIGLAWNKLPQNGVSWDGGRFVYSGTGSGNVTVNALTADDGQGHSVASSTFTITIAAASSPTWQTLPSQSFVAGAPADVDLGACISGYSSGTDVFSAHPSTPIGAGTPLPWLTLTGTGGRTERASGAQTAGTFSVNLGVQRSGGAIVYTGPLTVTVTTAPVLPTAGVYRALTDTYNVVTGEYFSRTHIIPWRNNGGDWLDNTNAPQGNLTYGSAAPSPSLTPIVFSGVGLINLIDKWRTSGNSGAFIRARTLGPPDARVNVSTRHGVAAPTLSVTVGGTPYNCPCTASLGIAPVLSGSGLPRTFPDLYGEEEQINAIGPIHHMLQFDLSAVPSGTITAATMQLHPSFYSSGTNDLFLDLYEVNTPRIVIDPLTEAGGAPVAGGIAEAYPWDVGIEEHTDVIFATAFEPGFSNKWIDENPAVYSVKPDEFYYTSMSIPAQGATWYPGQPGALPDKKEVYQGNPPIVGADSNFGGRHSLTWYYMTNENDILYGISAGSSNARLGFRAVHAFSVNEEPHLEELWTRVACIQRGPPIPNQGMKYGITVYFDMGWQHTDGKWYKVTGNGGAPCTGYWYPMYLHPKTTYGPSTTEVILTGGPWNGTWILKTIGDGSSKPENSGYCVWSGTTPYNFGYPAIDGATAMRAQVLGHTGSGDFIDCDGNGEVHLINVQHHDGTNWVSGLGTTFTPSMNVLHEQSIAIGGTDLDRLLANPINYKNGEPGFYSGGTVRYGSQAIFAETNYSVLADEGANFRVRTFHPNVTDLIRTGETFWLDRDANFGNQYTYTGPNLNSDNNGHVVIAKANVSPALINPTVTPGELFDCCDAIVRHCLDSDPNPLKQYNALDPYVYDADHLGIYSGWTYPVGSHSVGWPVIEQDKMLSHELMVRMNDVDPPFDPYGNGVPVRNGVLRIELDGVVFLNKTDMFYRAHPGLQINSGGYDSTLGGQVFPIAVYGTGKTEGPIVFAKSRIGPLKQGAGGGGGPDPGSLPPWRQTNSAPYTLYNVTAQGETAAAKYAQNSAYLNYGGNTQGMSVNSVTTHSIGAWSMRVIAEDMGTHGTFLCGMNGHEAGHGQLLLNFDIGTATWKDPLPNNPANLYYVATPGNINPPAGCDMFYVHPSVTQAEMAAAGYIAVGTGPDTQPTIPTSGKWWDLNAGAPDGNQRWAYPTWTADPICGTRTNNGEYSTGMGCSMRYDSGTVLPASGGGDLQGTLVIMPSLFGHTFPSDGTVHAHKFGLNQKTWSRSTNSERTLGGRAMSGDNNCTAYSSRYGKIYQVAQDSAQLQIYDPVTDPLSRKPLVTAGQGMSIGYGNATITNGLSGAHLFIFHVYRTETTGVPVLTSGIGVIDLDEVEGGGAVNLYGIFAPGTTGVGSNAFPRLQGVTFDYSTHNNTDPQKLGYATRLVHLQWAKTRKVLILYQTVNKNQDTDFWQNMTGDPYTGTATDPPANVLHTILVPETGATWKTNTWQGTHRTVLLGGGCKGLWVNKDRHTHNMYKGCSWCERTDTLMLLGDGAGPVQHINIG